MSVNPARKNLLLIGAGSAHLQVLKGLARQMSSDLAVTLVTPTPYYIEPRMLSGLISGHYTLEDMRLPLDPLVEASGVQFVPAHALALDPVNRHLHLSNEMVLPYDVLSVDIEPTQEREHIEALVPGARTHAMFLHPLEGFVQLWPQLQQLAGQRPLQVAVIADDTAGVELALAVAHALSAPHGSRVTLVIGDQPLLAGQPEPLRQRVQRHLRQLKVTVLQDRCTGIDDSAVHLASGASLQCDAPIFTGSATLPSWLLQAGLQTDENGQLQVNKRLQSDSHRQIFVVPPSVPPEAGPALEANLRTALGGGSFKKVPLEVPRLRVFDCGNRQAIATWGALSLEGREVWNWKDRRDRRQLAELLTP